MLPTGMLAPSTPLVPRLSAEVFAAAGDSLLATALGSTPLPSKCQGQRELARREGAPDQSKAKVGVTDIPESKTLGRLHLTKAKTRAYVCHKSAATQWKPKYLFEVRADKAMNQHVEVCERVRARIVEADLTKDQAKEYLAKVMEEMFGA